MDTKRTVYLDCHATTPVDKRVVAEMVPYYTEHWGNPASKDHRQGATARDAVEKARGEIALAIGARPDEIIFTSGATEANNLALFGVLGRSGPRQHVITSAIEHRAVLDCVDALGRNGVDVTILPVDEYGRVDPDSVRRAIRDNTALVSIMAANNEIGTLQPLAAIGAITRANGTLFHCDAAQSAYIDIDVKASCIDLLSISAHKVYGPKGIGILYVSNRKPRVRLAPLLYGGGHERGMRSGTLNVPGIVGASLAMRIALEERKTEVVRLRELTSRLLAGLKEIGDVDLHGHPTARLANNLNVRFHGVKSKALVVNLPDIAFSTGSACTTQKAQPSHVLFALGLESDQVAGAVRFGLGRFTTPDEVEYAVDRFKAIVPRLRSARGAGRE
jgi:cysteine desulfurase